MNNIIDNLLMNKNKLYRFATKLSNIYCFTYIIGFIFCIIAFLNLTSVCSVLPTISFPILESILLLFNLPIWFIINKNLRRNEDQLYIQINSLYKLSFILSFFTIILGMIFIGTSCVLLLHGLFPINYNAIIIGIILYHYTLLFSSFFNLLFMLTLNAIFRT